MFYLAIIAGAGIGPAFTAYETVEEPLLNPAMEPAGIGPASGMVTIVVSLPSNPHAPVSG